MIHPLLVHVQYSTSDAVITLQRSDVHYIPTEVNMFMVLICTEGRRSQMELRAGHMTVGSLN